MKNLLLLLALLISTLAYSHGVAIADADRSEYLRLHNSKIAVSVNNQIATVTTVQTFYNDSNDSLKIKYAFPLPSSANPIYFRYRIQDEMWQEAVFSSEGQDDDLPGSGSSGGGGGSGGTASPGLSSYLGATPFYFDFKKHIPKGQSVEIELIYVQLLTYEFGIVEFHYPNNYSAIQEEIALLEFKMELSSGREITAIELLDHTADYQLQTNYAEASLVNEDILLDTDLVINYSLISDKLGSYAMSTQLPDSTAFCDNHGAGFLTMILEPESSANTQVIQKNFCLVIDRSGSMQGDKMIQAIDAANFIVNNLNDGDYFNIVDFNGEVNSFSDNMVEANDANTVDAVNYITQLRSNGSTDIASSLQRAIENFGGIDTTKANIIIFFTDGKPTTGLQLPFQIIDAINSTVQSLETGIFLFTFGIGENVNKGLLTSLAIENSGLATFLQNDELEKEITEFFLKINNPVLINTEVSFSPEVITELFPHPLPNLYEGQQLILSGRYQEAVPVEMKLKGQFYNQQIEYNFNIDLSDSLAAEYSILPQIWAKQKVDALTINHLLSPSSSEQALIQADIDTIGSCYGVVSVQFNSFSDSALEIDYVEFRLQLEQEKNVMVSWSTIAENNNDKFIVQRSRDTKEWEDIAVILGQTDSDQLLHYNYLDKQPHLGVNYYRIATVDVNGKISYTSIEAIVVDQQEEVLLYPNPVLTGTRLYISSKMEEALTVNVFSTEGQLLTSSEILASGSIAMNDYPAGIYLVVLSNYMGFRKVEQVVVK